MGENTKQPSNTALQQIGFLASPCASSRQSTMTKFGLTSRLLGSVRSSVSLAPAMPGRHHPAPCCLEHPREDLTDCPRRAPGHSVYSRITSLHQECPHDILKNTFAPRPLIHFQTLILTSNISVLEPNYLSWVRTRPVRKLFNIFLTRDKKFLK